MDLNPFTCSDQYEHGSRSEKDTDPSCFNSMSTSAPAELASASSTVCQVVKRDEGQDRSGQKPEHPKSRPILASNYLLELQTEDWRSPAANAACKKVFTTVMLHAWRQRREEVQQLQKSLKRLLNTTMKTKNQLHVYTTLVNVEQKRNSELQMQLVESTQRIIQVRSSCDSLTTSVLSLTADKALLKQELNCCKKECVALKKRSTDNKQLLFESLMEQRHLKLKCIVMDEDIKALQSENDRLCETVAKMRDSNFIFDNRVIERSLRQQMEQKDNMIQSLRKVIEGLENRICEWKNKDIELQDLRNNELHMTEEIAELRSQLEASLKQRQAIVTVTGHPNDNYIIKIYKNFDWRSLTRRTANFLNLFWLYTLPGMPMHTNFTLQYPFCVH